MSHEGAAFLRRLVDVKLNLLTLLFILVVGRLTTFARNLVT